MGKYRKKRHTFIKNDYAFFTQIGRFVFFVSFTFVKYCFGCRFNLWTVSNCEYLVYQTGNLIRGQSGSINHISSGFREKSVQ